MCVVCLVSPHPISLCNTQCGTDTCSWQFFQSFSFFLSRELESPRTQCHAVCHTPGRCGFAAWVTYSASLGLSARAYVLIPSPCRTSLMIALVCGLCEFPASNFSCLLTLFISVHPDPNLQFPLRISIWEEGDELWQFPPISCLNCMFNNNCGGLVVWQEWMWRQRGKMEFPISGNYHLHSRFSPVLRIRKIFLKILRGNKGRKELMQTLIILHCSVSEIECSRQHTRESTADTLHVFHH